MKIKNIFKKNTKTVVSASVETLAKNQLEKVAGGAELLGNAVPGAGIVSAAVSSVGNTGTTGGASSASYAATGRTAK